MAQAVRHVLDQLFADALILQAVMQLLDDSLDDEDVGALVMAADIVNFAVLAAVGNHINGFAVVHDIQPVTDLHTIAVNRQGLVVLGVVDEQRNQLFGELIRTIVVGAAGDVDGHAIGIMECFHEHIGAGFGSGVRAVRAQRGRFHKVAFGAQGTVYFIGGNLQVLFAFLPGLGVGIVPGILAALQQVNGAQNIGLNKNFRVADAAVNVALGSKVDDVIRVIFGDQVSDKSLIADIALNKDMAGIVLDIFQVFQVAGIGQLIQVDQADILVFFQHIVDKVGANKTGTAGNKISFHLFTIPIIEKVLNCIFPVAHVIADTAPQGAVFQCAPCRAVCGFGVHLFILCAGNGLYGARQAGQADDLGCEIIPAANAAAGAVVNAVIMADCQL